MVKRGFRVAAWILLALAVLAIAVIVLVGALRAHGTEEFNRWVGLATVAAVPLAAGGLILMFWDKITASAARLTRSDDSGEMQARQWPDRGDGLGLAEPIHGRAESSGQAVGTNLGTVVQTGTVNLGSVAPDTETEKSSGALRPGDSGWSGDTLPLRNPTFTGRTEMLEDLAERLAAGPVAVVACAGWEVWASRSWRWSMHTGCASPGGISWRGGCGRIRR